jgi:hypothetical protein
VALGVYLVGTDSAVPVTVLVGAAGSRTGALSAQITVASRVRAPGKSPTPSTVYV